MVALLDGYEPKPAKKLTSKEIARFLIDELECYEYMAATYRREAAGYVQDLKRAVVFGGYRECAQSWRSMM